MVLPNFVRAALAGQPVTVFGDGTQSRCFCHVSDTVGALAQLIEHPKAVGEIFNVGSEEEITIGELAQLVKFLTRSSSPIQYIPYEEAYEHGFEDIERRVPNLSKIHQLIGFEAELTLQQIILDVGSYHRKFAVAAAAARTVVRSSRE